VQVISGIAAMAFLGSALLVLIAVPFLASPAKRPRAKRLALWASGVAAISVAVILATAEPKAAVSPADQKEAARLEQIERNRRAAEDRKAEINSREDRNCTDGSLYVMSQRFVKSGLKAPSTADFPWSATSVSMISRCRRIVSGYVDAQNSFGAMIRSNWAVDIEYSPDTDTYQAHRVEIQ